MARPRRWSIWLWVVAVAFGFTLTLRKAQIWRVAILVVIPSGEAQADTAKELTEALENEVGEQGLSPELRVLSRHLETPTERTEVEQLGFATPDEVTCGVVECDEADRPVRLVNRFPVAEDVRDTAHEAVTSARDWAGK